LGKDLTPQQTLKGAKGNLAMCYESPKMEVNSCMFENLIHNIKSYNGVKI